MQLKFRRNEISFFLLLLLLSGCANNISVNNDLGSPITVYENETTMISDKDDAGEDNTIVVDKESSQTAFSFVCKTPNESINNTVLESRITAYENETTAISVKEDVDEEVTEVVDGESFQTTSSNIYESPIDSIIDEVFFSDNKNGDEGELEDIARKKVYRNLICTYTYYTQSMFDWLGRECDEEGYYHIKFLYFDGYEDFSKFVYDTYINTKALSIINNFQGNGKVFINKDDEVWYNQNLTSATNEPFFGKNFTITINKYTEDLCEFTCYSECKNETEITNDWFEMHCIHKYIMTKEGGEWLLNDMVYMF